MKPLPPQQLTDEDMWVWCYALCRDNPTLRPLDLWHADEKADRRDAELMLSLSAGFMLKTGLNTMTVSFQWSYEGAPKLVLVRVDGRNITNFA